MEFEFSKRRPGQRQDWEGNGRHFSIRYKMLSSWELSFYRTARGKVYEKPESAKNWLAFWPHVLQHQIGTTSKFSDKDNFLLRILSSKLELNIMPSDWGNDTHKWAPLVYCAHHPQGIEWHFRKLANPSQNTEGVEEGVERMREGGK